MGASGAGKTSLFNIVSHRVRIDKNVHLTGKVMINDQIASKDSFAKCSGYVMQDDILFSHFTVKEALTFAARLKLHNLSKEEQNLRVD
mmetsp:Transcript_37699/g.27404  ORF Transcript_37699/g.27404 Transcript_37699/m.27404 type:complete len:88 (-) Transcript_37699:1473-1736(-)